MLHLQGKRAHTLVVAAWNVQALGREVELIFWHGFCGFHNFLFDGADLTVHGRNYGWRRWVDDCALFQCAFSQDGRGSDEDYRNQREHLFHRSRSLSCLNPETVDFLSDGLITAGASDR